MQVVGVRAARRAEDHDRGALRVVRLDAVDALGEAGRLGERERGGDRGRGQRARAGHERSRRRVTGAMKSGSSSTGCAGRGGLTHVEAVTAPMRSAGDLVDHRSLVRLQLPGPRWAGNSCRIVPVHPS